MRSIQYIFDSEVLQYVVKIALLCVLVVIALINDIKSYRVPNKLNLIFLILGLTANLLFGNIKMSLIGMVFPLVLFPLFMFRMMGAGDIKLFCAIGAIVAMPDVLYVMAYGIIANGIIAIIIMIVRKNIEGFKRLWNWVTFCIICRQFAQYQSLDKDNKSIFRYAYGITIGSVYYIVEAVIMHICR